ncbi:MAG: glycogen phosphorylase, partial [Chloroflexota bacterium]|nr:glycogen phosphorylase [Chloroflexota bacterium]
MLRALGPDAATAALERTGGLPPGLARVQVGLPGREAWGAELGGGVAYFSMEFAFTDHLPIFSGGLGVLAADHVKAASQLGLPVVGIGLLYRTAFARQAIDADGAQLSTFPATDVRDLPVEPLQRDRRQARVTVPVGAEEVHVDLWRTWVGSLPMILLDTATEDNPEHLRGITDRLYPSDPEARLRQEILLGIGGVRALRAANLAPTLFHLNEGHSFLAPFELLRERIARGEDPDRARAALPGSTIFTTHTPVAAGSDYFEPGLVAGLLGPFLESAGVGVDEFMGWGRLHPDDGGERLCTTYVALRAAGTSVGVSRLHGAVSRRLWRGAGPAIEGGDDQVPSGSVTNGVHMPTWVAPEIAAL